MAPVKCPACRGTRELRVNLDFQPGAGDGDFKVISALLPDKAGVMARRRGRRCHLLPVSSRTRRQGGKQTILPYWQVVGKQARYGQHAACLDHAQFDSLIAQVHEKVEEKVLQPA
jgi:hypothetical protein